jgi:hypothetical protein
MIERSLPPLLPLMPRRVPLGLTVWTPIPRGAPCVIRTYSQLDAFWPERLLLRDPGHWIINEASIEGQPWLGATNGAVYSPAEWTRLPVREVPAGGEVQLSVTYIGPRDEGESFEAVLFGAEAHVPGATPGIPTTSASRVCVRARSVAVGELAEVRLSAPASGFCPDRLVIEDASDWAIGDVRVRGVSILTQEGGFAGELFAGRGDALPLRLGYLPPGEVVEVVASHVGERRSTSIPFVAELSGPVARPPDRAEVHHLPPTLIQPLCSGVGIPPYSSATLYGRPQLDRVPRGYGFLPERVVFANPRDWIIGDVKVGVCCQYARSDDVPGVAFASDAVGVHLRLDPVRARVDFAVTATYVGARESGACFLGGVQGSLVRLAAP